MRKEYDLSHVRKTFKAIIDTPDSILGHDIWKAVKTTLQPNKDHKLLYDSDIAPDPPLRQYLATDVEEDILPVCFNTQMANNNEFRDYITIEHKISESTTLTNERSNALQRSIPHTPVEVNWHSYARTMFVQWSLGIHGPSPALQSIEIANVNNTTVKNIKKIQHLRSDVIGFKTTVYGDNITTTNYTPKQEELNQWKHKLNKNGYTS